MLSDDHRLSNDELRQLEDTILDLRSDHEELPPERIVADAYLDPGTVRHVLNRAADRSPYVGLVREDVWTVKSGIVMTVDVAGGGFELERAFEY